MRVAVVVVGTTPGKFRKPRANAERIKLAEEIAKTCKDVDLVVLPAGYLTARPGASQAVVRTLAKDLAAEFPNGLIAGIDVAQGRKGKKSSKLKPKRVALNNWAFASKKGQVIGKLWRQRTATSTQRTPNTKARVVSFAKKKVGVLICGELYNHQLAQSLAARAPRLIVDAAHLSMKRFTKSLARVSRTTKATALHTQHVSANALYPKAWWARPHAGTMSATPKITVRSGSGLWASIKTWKV